MYRVQVAVVLVLITISGNVFAKQGYGPGEQDWDFVEVREGAHMFYWLYFTTANAANYTERPLVLWLQGGPGDGSTGYGNFRELGPIDIHGKERYLTWVKEANVLFVDNPVGAGFSYVDDLGYLASNNSQIASDLMEFMKIFYRKHPEFVSVPLHIFGESYGGKMAPEFALQLNNAIQDNEIKCNLSSVVLGDPWVSPIDSVAAMAPLMLNTSIIDEIKYEKITVMANRTLVSLENKAWVKANEQYAIMRLIIKHVYKVDANNLKKSIEKGIFTSDQDDQELEKWMNGAITKALDIPENVKWGSQSKDIVKALEHEIMKPIVNIISKLLNETNLRVGVYSGEFDLLCPTAGTVNWIEKLEWLHRNEYVKAAHKDIIVNEDNEGSYKSGGNLSMFWVKRAGHSVPTDNAKAMLFILNKFIYNN